MTIKEACDYANRDSYDEKAAQKMERIYEKFNDSIEKQCAWTCWFDRHKNDKI